MPDPDRSRLTALAEAALQQRYRLSMTRLSRMGLPPVRSEFIAACSPDVVLALLADVAAAEVRASTAEAALQRITERVQICEYLSDEFCAKMPLAAGERSLARKIRVILAAALVVGDENA